MTDLVSAAEMRATEAAAIESGRVTGLDLMERAGRGVVQAAMACWPELHRGQRRAVVACGPGNNGGDGFVIARLLVRQGWEVGVYLYGDPARLPPDAAVMYDRWRRLGQVRPLADLVGGFGAKGPDLVVDAVFGTGLARPLGIEVAEPLGDIHAWRLRHGAHASMRVVAVDLPSGLGTDDGEDLGAPLAADLTVTFHRRKPGHVTGMGPQLCGRVVVADIGLPQPAPASGGAA